MAYNGNTFYIGVWRSQVARTLGVGEAVGSNPATPIQSKPKKQANSGVEFVCFFFVRGKYNQRTKERIEGFCL